MTIQRLTDISVGDHYHVCNGCGLESSPSECVELAIDCVDLPCSTCLVEPSKELTVEVVGVLLTPSRQVREPNTAYLFELPDCDICATTGQSVKAAYDGSMVRTGSWAYMCEMHFQKYGVGLGVGRGQRLALRLDVD